MGAGVFLALIGLELVLTARRAAGTATQGLQAGVLGLGRHQGLVTYAIGHS